MEIKWNNVIAMALIVAALVLLVNTPDSAAPFVELFGQLGADNEPEEQMVGLVAVALLGLCVVAIVKSMQGGE